MSKRTIRLIFFNIFIPVQHDLYNSHFFKITDKANSKFKLKIKVKEASHINWRKPKLNQGGCK